MNLTLRLVASVLSVMLLGLPARADEAADSLRTAVRLAAASPDEAVDALPPDAQLNAGHVPLLYDAAEALGRSRPDAALRLVVTADRLEPGNIMIGRAIERFWTADPVPPSLRAADVAHLPVLSEACSLPAGTEGPAVDAVLLTPRPFIRVNPAAEPRSGAAYPGISALYIRRGEALERRFILHAASGTPPEATRTVAFLLAALDGASQRLKLAWSPPDPFHVWLSATGTPGAEQWGGSIIVHQAGARRAPLEWARQLSHEWGHASLRGITGFKEPEAWANGDLGERLYLPLLDRWGWLKAAAPGASAAPYTARYVTPLRERFARTGADRSLLADTSRKGFDHFLGGCLYIADAYGLDVLLDALDTADGNHPLDVFVALRRVLLNRGEHAVHRPPDASGPRPICIPADGVHILEGSGVRLDGRPVSGPLSLKAGWIRPEWSGALTVRRASGQ